jgi:hypothetical protein
LFKRTVTLVGLLLALSAPAALADSGTPAPSTAAPAGVDVQKLDRLHDRIDRVTRAFVRRCVNGKANADRCKSAAEKGIDRLGKISGRIDDRIAKIKARCDAGTSTQPVPKACGRAAERVERLRTLQTVVQALAAKLQAYLDSGPATTGGGGSTSAGGDTTGLESLDQLAADLAAAQAAAGN